MTDVPVYLDNAATTRLAPEARDAMLPWLGDTFGNPSSRHRFGVRAAEAVEAARGHVARAVGGAAANVVFTGGGTEANNLAVLGVARARARHGRHVVLGPTEHACVRNAARVLANEGFEVERASLTSTGALDLDDLAARLRDDTVLVAQMLVQNELGTIYPCRRVAKLTRARAPHAWTHVDAVQAFGKLELSLAALDVDSLSLSAHKAHGPQGVGALVLKDGPRPAPLIHGGGQEGGTRSGTENVAGVVGFGAAARVADSELPVTERHFAALRQRFVAGLERLPDVAVIEPGRDAEGVCAAIVAFRVAGAPAEVVMHHLEEHGVVVGAGSACQSKKSDASPAMLALGIDAAEVRRILRLSFSRMTHETDVDRALEALATTCRELTAVRR